MVCEQLKISYKKAFSEYLALVDAGSPQPRTRQIGEQSYVLGLEYRACLLKSAAIEPMVDLNGRWSYEGVMGPVISVAMDSLEIDMSKYSRPTAHGILLSPTDITVTFPDAGTITAKLVKETFTGLPHPPEFIKWSNGTAWSKVYSGHGIVIVQHDVETELAAQ